MEEHSQRVHYPRVHCDMKGKKQVNKNASALRRASASVHPTSSQPPSLRTPEETGALRFSVSLLKVASRPGQSLNLRLGLLLSRSLLPVPVGNSHSVLGQLLTLACLDASHILNLSVEVTLATCSYSLTAQGLQWHSMNGS